MKILLSDDFYAGDKKVPGPINSGNAGKQTEFFNKLTLLFDADFVGTDRIDTELIVNKNYNRLDWTDSYGRSIHNLYTVSIINNWGFYIKDWFTLKSGGDFTYSYLDSSDLKLINKFDGGGYLTAEFSIKKTAQIIPSVKLFYFKDYPIAVPKLGAVFYIGDNFILKNNFFRVFKLPALNDLYWQSSAFAEGNPELKNEDGFGSDIILSYTKNKILSAESSVYLTYFIDAIIWQAGSKGVWKPGNIGRAFYFGIDSSVKSLFSEYVKLSISYSFLLTYVLSEGFTFESDKRMPYQPVHNLGFSAEFNWKSGLVLFTGHYSAERYSTTVNVTELKPYFTFNIDFSQNIKILTLFMSVKNIFNYFYYLVDGYPMPGGSVTLGVKINYEKKFKDKKNDKELYKPENL